MLTTADVHQQVSWPSVLRQLGIAEEHRRNRHKRCPACDGRDCYRFDNKNGQLSP